MFNTRVATTPAELDRSSSELIVTVGILCRIEGANDSDPFIVLIDDVWKIVCQVSVPAAANSTFAVAISLSSRWDRRPRTTPWPAGR